MEIDATALKKYFGYEFRFIENDKELPFYFKVEGDNSIIKVTVKDGKEVTYTSSYKELQTETNRLVKLHNAIIKITSSGILLCTNGFVPDLSDIATEIDFTNCSLSHAYCHNFQHKIQITATSPDGDSLTKFLNRNEITDLEYSNDKTVQMDLETYFNRDLVILTLYDLKENGEIEKAGETTMGKHGLWFRAFVKSLIKCDLDVAIVVTKYGYDKNEKQFAHAKRYEFSDGEFIGVTGVANK